MRSLPVCCLEDENIPIPVLPNSEKLGWILENDSLILMLMLNSSVPQSYL